MVKGKIPFPILSDQNGYIGKLYGIYNDTTGKNLRSTFIIDNEGYIQAAEILAPSVGRNLSEILRLVKAYQHHLATGEAIPCDWRVGEKTLIPSISKAGEVWREWQPHL